MRNPIRKSLARSLSALEYPWFILAVIGFALVVVLRLAFRGKGMNTKAVHVELLRIDERLTSIEKLLKDIE